MSPNCRLPFIGILLAALLSASISAQLTPEERQGVADTLVLGNMTVNDLSFPRTAPSAPYLLPFVQSALAKPLDGADALLELHGKALSADSATAILGLLRKTVYAEKPTDRANGEEVDVVAHPAVSFPASVPPALAVELGKLVNAILESNSHVRGALSRISPEEKRYLVEQLPGMASDGLIKVAFGKREGAKEEKVLKLLAKVDLPAIREAAQRLTLTVESEAPKLQALAKSLNVGTIFKAKAGGLQVEVSNEEGYRHVATDNALCIAFGARSRFEGRYGAGIGYSSVLIDLSKESQYDVPDASAGVGILGVGVAYVSGGRHTFRSRSLAFGAGLAGVGVFVTGGGQNLYDSISMSQGFGSFGIGVLSTKGGENSFRSRFLSQGSARTGGVGWLIIQAGRNQLRCGQLVKDEPDGYRSMAQGFGGGFDSGLSGGLGLLTAKGGEDTYQGDSLCQGAGVSGGLGSAFNSGREVNWLATRRSQGAGSDAGGGFLFETGPAGTFTLREGFGHGAGHSEGVGFGLIRGPHQVVSARDGKPGFGSDRGIGLFLANGDDNRIYGVPGSGVGVNASGAVGLYFGMGGGNRFLEGAADGQASLRDSWGMSFSTGVPINAAEGDSAKLPVAGSLPMPNDSDMAELVKDLTLNRSKMVGAGKAALSWIFKHALKNLDAGDVREVAFLVRTLEGDDLLPMALTDPDTTIAANGLRIALAANAKGVEAGVVADLKRPGLELFAARAAGTLQVKDAVPDLIPLAGSPDHAIAAASAIALAQIGDERGVSTAQALVGSDNLLVRKAAVSFLAKYPQTGLSVAKNLVAGGDMRGRATGLELLGQIGTTEALELAGAYLGDQNVAVRVQAALALDGRCPQKLRAALLALKNDQNPLVRAVAARIDVGRG